MGPDNKFCNVTLNILNTRVALNSKDWDEARILNENEVKDCKCYLNNQEIDIEQYIKSENNKRLQKYFEEIISPILKEGEYEDILSYNLLFDSNQLNIGDKFISEINAKITFKYFYKIELNSELSNTIESYKNRLIGFFDILGFSKVLMSYNLNVLYARYAELIDQVNKELYLLNKENESQNFQKIQFLFDSIVIVSKPIENINNINNFINGCSSIFEKAFRQKLPLRGAITIGDFIECKKRNIFLSSAFSELVKLEKNQEWAGCIITESAKNIVLQAIEGDNPSPKTDSRQSSLLFEYTVPFKCNKNIPFLCINFCNFLSNAEIKNGLNYLKGDLSKYENTKAFIDFINQKNDDKLQISSSPQNLYIKFMKSRTGFRYRLVDFEGNLVIPEKSFKIPMKVIGEGKTLDIDLVFDNNDNN